MKIKGTNINTQCKFCVEEIEKEIFDEIKLDKLIEEAGQRDNDVVELID